MPSLFDRLPGAFTRALTPTSVLRYLLWRLRGTHQPVWLQLARAGWMGRTQPALGFSCARAPREIPMMAWPTKYSRIATMFRHAPWKRTK
jgi:hypothetical protein